MIEILDSDTRFSDSPQLGPDCLCSRCGKPILAGVPLRMHPSDMTEDPATQHEYRYHNVCQGLDPSFDENNDDDDDDWLRSLGYYPVSIS